MCAAGEDIAWDLAPFVSQVVLSGKKWIKEEFAMMSAPFGGRANMLRRPWVSKMHTDGTVEFEDGSCVENIDVVMFCTGAALLQLFPHRHGSTAHILCSSGTVLAAWHVFLVRKSPVLSHAMPRRDLRRKLWQLFRVGYTRSQPSCCLGSTHADRWLFCAFRAIQV